MIRVRVEPRFLEEFFLTFPRYLVENGVRLKLFRPHTSPLERILMEKFGMGEET